MEPENFHHAPLKRFETKVGLMYIETLQRHLYICSAQEVDAIVSRDKNFWNLVCIHEPAFPKTTNPLLKSVHYSCFHDTEVEDADAPLAIPRLEHLKEIFAFVDSKPGEPVIVQCRAGQSRSTAVALGLLVRGFHPVISDTAELIEESVDTLLKLRGISRPNPLVLRLALQQFLDEEAARDLVIQLVNHPILMENRSNIPRF